jgi:general L-amino acid transport system substrate-binding protein
MAVLAFFVSQPRGFPTWRRFDPRWLWRVLPHVTVSACCTPMRPRGNDQETAMTKLHIVAIVVSMAAFAAPVSAGPTLDAVKQRGEITCGVNTGISGFSAPDSRGEWKGIDVDVCRAVAAALFGNASKVKFVGLTAAQRFTALQSGEVDILSRNTTATLTRDTSLGINVAGINYYDGQGFLVSKKAGVKSVKELNGATICVQQGTTTELNMADYFRANKIDYRPVVIEKLEEVIAAFFAGRCDAFTADASNLAATRSTNAQNADDFMILPEIISKEPLGPMVRHGDDQWFDLVKWSFIAMVEAEEYGVTSKNADEMLTSPNPGIQRLLGATPGLGKVLGVDEKWAYNIVKQVGNYGESFDRNVGAGSPLKLERGLNALWTQGGLMYAWPVR